MNYEPSGIIAAKIQASTVVLRALQATKNGLGVIKNVKDCLKPLDSRQTLNPKP